MLFRRKKNKRTVLSLNERDLIRNCASHHLKTSVHPQEVGYLKGVLSKNGLSCSEEEILQLIENEISLQREMQKREAGMKKIAVEKEKPAERRKKVKNEYNEEEMKEKRRQFKENRKRILNENKRIKFEIAEIKRKEEAKKKEKECIEREKRVEQIEKRKIEIAKKKEQEFKEKTQELLSSENYVLLKKFVKKYGQDYARGPTDDLEKKIRKFRRLMEAKGTILSPSQLRKLIVMEIKLQEYEAFSSRMLYNQPNNIMEYVKNLVDIYGENYSQYKDLFLKLLKENKIVFNENNLNTLIQSTIEQKELELLENELLDFDSYNTEIINSLDSLTGYEFEDFLKGLFNKMGFTAETTKLSGDQGADLIIEKFGKKIAVQAKRYNGKVGNTAIQEVTASIAYYGANRGMVVTTGEFTVSAIELARSNRINLIGRQKLEELIQKYY